MRVRPPLSTTQAKTELSAVTRAHQELVQAAPRPSARECTFSASPTRKAQITRHIPPLRVVPQLPTGITAVRLRTCQHGALEQPSQANTVAQPELSILGRVLLRIHRRFTFASPRLVPTMVGGL